MAYDNSRREQAARATRRRVLDAAAATFLEHGYSGSTIRLIAEAAGVSQETIYKTFGGKAALLKAVYDVTLVGDDEDVPLAGRPEAMAVTTAESPSQAARAYAELASMISQRLDPLLRLVVGARDTDPALAAFARTTDAERRAGATYYVSHWNQRGWIRNDIPLEHAIDSVWALNSSQPRWLLLDHGWTEAAYTQWLADLIHVAVFDVSRD